MHTGPANHFSRRDVGSATWPMRARLIATTLGLLIGFSGGQGPGQMRAAEGTKPAVEARGVWLHLSDFSADPQQGKAEVQLLVKKLAEANFNFIMPWVLSEYIAALRDPEHEKAAPTASWDALGEVAREAAQH